jgi:2-methylaconitate cis-trans-isomerase PrpF
MFPNGATNEILTVSSPSVGTFNVRVSLVDAANPFVLVDASSISIEGYPSWPDPNDTAFVSVVEDIRRAGAVRFGLAADTQTAGQVRGTPKIAFLSPAAEDDKDADLQVLAFTMGKPHASLQLTGAVCLGAAASIHGTVAWKLAGGNEMNRVPKHGMSLDGQEIASPLPIGIRHPAGVIFVETMLGMDLGGEVNVQKVAVFRTARRLFEGNVFYRAG